MDGSYATIADSAWKPLYKVAGVAALIIAGLTVIQAIIFIAWPPPGTVIGYFTLLQNNRLLGLLSLDLLSMAVIALMGLIWLALYVALRRTSQSFMAIALTLAIVAVALYFSSNTVFNMLSLSSQYAAATTEAQRSSFLAAGQASLRSTRALLSTSITSSGALSV